MVVPVDSQNGVRKYVWDNSTTEFSYPYIIESDSLFATLYNNNGELVLEIPSTAYTLSDPTRNSGVLTITDANVLATDADLIILERIEELSQELDLGKRDFPPQDIEDAFDKSRIIDQQQQALTNRGVITNITEDREEPIELPVAIEGLVLAWDADGNLINTTTTGTSLPAVPNTYLKRNNDNDAFNTLTSSELLTDIGGASTSLVATNTTAIEFNKDSIDITKPINDKITWLTSSTVNWYGKALSSDSSNIIEVDSGSPITADITKELDGITTRAVGNNTTYHMFVYIDTDDSDTIKAYFSTTVDGVDITYTAKRRVLSIITDGVGNIIEFSVFNNNNESKIVYNNGGITEYAAVLPSNSNLNQIITVPSVDLEVELFASSFRGSGIGLTKIVNTNSTVLPVDLTEVNSDIIASGASANDLGFGRQFININNGQIKLLQSFNESTLFRLSTRAYKIWR